MSHYQFFTQGYSHSLILTRMYWVMKAEAQYLYPYIIKENVCNTNYEGINGGFYCPDDYGNSDEWDDGVSISWYKGFSSTQICTHNGDSNALVARGTLYCYAENNAFNYGVVKARTVTELKNAIGSSKDFRYMIGGGDLMLGKTTAQWEQSFNDEQWGMGQTIGPVDGAVECGRTGIGLKKEGTKWYAYLVIAADSAGVSLNQLRDYIGNGLGCTAGIFLDGSASTQMRAYDTNNNLYTFPGYKVSPVSPYRKVWNMIRVI